MPPVYAMTSSSGPEFHDTTPGGGESPSRVLPVDGADGRDWEPPLGGLDESWASFIVISGVESWGLVRVISPTVARRPIMLAATSPADRTWTWYAILRSAPAVCGDHAQVDD